MPDPTGGVPPARSTGFAVSEPAPLAAREVWLLLTVILVIATAGLIYELVMATVASYLLGDSVTQFSLVIGTYLSALGAGAYTSRWVDRSLLLTFVNVELATALIGGFSAPALFLAFAYTKAFPLILYGTVLAVGVLVGLELPLLIRILERRLAFKELIARALTFDYAGALVGSLGFSLVLVPELGVVRGSLASGFANALVALLSTFVLRAATPDESRALMRARWRAACVVLLLALGLLGAGRLSSLTEAALYAEPIVLSRESRHQHIVLTEEASVLRLYLNGNLQFSSDDEARYHESLVHPAMANAARRLRVLIGGGGDGLAAREVLRWPDVEAVTVVDLDAEITNLARDEPALSTLNRGAFRSPKLRVVNADAMSWLGRAHDPFDVILLDFPDPTSYSLGKLYSRRFYRQVFERLADDGALAVQATSPLFARRTYWSVVTTLKSAGFYVAGYHAFVPSFGDWGFVLASKQPLSLPTTLPPPDPAGGPLAFLTPERLGMLFEFPEDAAEVPAEVNRLDNQAIVRSYLEEWGRWN